MAIAWKIDLKGSEPGDTKIHLKVITKSCPNDKKKNNNNLNVTIIEENVKEPYYNF